MELSDDFFNRGDLIFWDPQPLLKAVDKPASNIFAWNLQKA